MKDVQNLGARISLARQNCGQCGHRPCAWACRAGLQALQASHGEPAWKLGKAAYQPYSTRSTAPSRSLLTIPAHSFMIRRLRSLGYMSSNNPCVMLHVIKTYSEKSRDTAPGIDTGFLTDLLCPISPRRMFFNLGIRMDAVPK